MNSRLLVGQVNHSRFLPKKHVFDYRIFLFLIDLDEIDLLSRKIFLFGTRFWHFIRFKREDFHQPKKTSLKKAVQETVAEKTGLKLKGKVYIATNLRILGYNFNPVSFYYLYDDADQLAAIMAEIENTPWGERYAYAFKVESHEALKHTFRFEKDFHVSPFMPMNQHYLWEFTTPSDKAWIHMTSFENEQKKFTASLAAKTLKIKSSSLLSCLVRNPLMPQKVTFGIYVQALRLFLKKIPFFDHPDPNSQINFNWKIWRKKNV